MDSHLQALKDQIDALTRETFQQEQEKGAKLHAEKNAPSVSGLYVNLKFPPYVYREFPKMLYHGEYLAACVEFDASLRIRPTRDFPEARENAILLAQRRKDEATRIVHSHAEQEALGSLWCETPTAAIEAQRRLESDVARAAAESNFDDRRLGTLAARERAAVDDASEGHLVEVPETKRKPMAAAK